MRRLSVLILALALAGCCTCRERYRPALTAWRDALQNRVRPALVEGLRDKPEPVRKSKVGLLDDVVNGIKRVDGEGPEVWKESE